MPFRERRQSIAASFLAAQPIAKRHGVLPGDQGNRVLFAGRELRMAPDVAGVALGIFSCVDARPAEFVRLARRSMLGIVHETPELRDCHLRRSSEERSAALGGPGRTE